MDRRRELASEYNKCAQQVKELYDKLRQAYDKEDDIISRTKILKLQYEQLQEDKEVLQMMYMHHSNKLNRIKQVLKNG